MEGVGKGESEVDVEVETKEEENEEGEGGLLEGSEDRWGKLTARAGGWG